MFHSQWIVLNIIFKFLKLSIKTAGLWSENKISSLSLLFLCNAEDIKEKTV